MSALIGTPAGWQRHERGAFALHVDPTREAPLAFALAVAAGLDDRPRWLDSRYLYDDEGSALFERITQQPEYYQTRAEEALLARHAREIRALVGDVPLVELGSGSSAKTRRLLDVWTAAAASRYLPVDVSAGALEQACAGLAACYPALAIEGLAASYERALPVLAPASPMVLVFLGSSLGNLGKHGQDELLDLVARRLLPGDFFLVGLDFAKDAGTLEAAYDDAAGVTAAFTRNLFARMNRELGTDVPLDAVEHVACYSPEHERVEIYAELRREVVLRLDSIGRDFRLARGERIRTELSYKYRPEAATAAIERHGFRLEWRGEDERGFGLFLFRRVPPCPGVRPVRADLWGAVLDRVRARTWELVAPLDGDDLTRQPGPLSSPLLWDLGHVANFEAAWLLRALAQAGCAGDGAAAALDPLYDPRATPRAERGRLALPWPEETRAYADHVRRRVHAQLDRVARGELGGPFVDGGCLFHLVAQHEAQHQEAMLQALAQREDRPYRPAFAEAAHLPLGARSPADSVLVPGGPFVMGTDDHAWAYDNERPAHEVHVPAFRLDVAATTNGQYLAFIEDGGYRRPELWSPEGWRWREDGGAVAPGHWRRVDERWHALVFGEPRSIHPDCPVVHVSWFEADAFARWAGKRLPTEAEWEKAAAWDVARQASRPYPWGEAAPEPARANLDQRRLEPAPAGASARGRSPYGCLQMLGDVWEWTATWFGGYPGFRSFPKRDGSETFFDGRHRVLRGGSFATAAIVARNTFRGRDLPQRRHIFAGFRCAQDA